MRIQSVKGIRRVFDRQTSATLRVLWFKDNDIGSDIVEYRLKRLPFGLNCSMSMADYCLRKTAYDNVGVSAEATEVIKSSFYVDDGLISCKDAAEGRKYVIALLQAVRWV